MSGIYAALIIDVLLISVTVYVLAYIAWESIRSRRKRVGKR